MNPSFPVSTPLMVVWAIALLAVTALFVQSLILLNRKGKRRAIVAIFTLLLLAGAAIHVVLLTQSHHTVTEGNWIQLVLVSLVASLEMFIAQTSIFDDVFAAVIFHEPAILLAYISIFVLIIAFTLSMVLLIMPQRLRDRTWLWMNAGKARRPRKNHIFLGLDPRSRAFAKAILKGWEAKPDRTKQGDVILVEFPDGDRHKQELSIGELISNIFGRQKEQSLEKQLGSDRFVLLKGRIPGGLPKLDPWLQNPQTTVYLLSSDEEQNVALLKLLATDASVKAKILCYSHQVNSYTSLMAAMGDRVRILNLPEMSFGEIKQNHPELHPIRFADIARNKAGEPLGYVKSGFTSMVIGFGETGQEALRYIYEFGSFIGEDLQPVPNTFKVYDPLIETLKGDFLNRTPALRYKANIEWSPATIGMSQFWLDYAMALPSLTYVVISVGSCERNVEIGVQLLQEAARFRKDLSHLCILMCAGDADAQMLQLIDFYNRSYCPEGVSVLHPFGLPDRIWTLDVISGKSLKKRVLSVPGAAKRWEERSREIRSRGGNELLNRQELMRKQAGEIGRSLFAPTLSLLCPERLRPLAEAIPDEPKGAVHFKGTKADYKTMEYLAAGEHLHWMTALEAAGYIDGAGVQDELNKKVVGMVPYQALPDENARHLCWLGLKEALLSWNKEK